MYNNNIHIIKTNSKCIKNVIHISDLHFTMKDKYDHYENVFNNFTKHLKKYNNNDSIVIITGDIFNEKNKLDSKLVFFSKKMIYNISNIFTTFIICGNHDFIQQNRKIPDTISSVFYDNKEDSDYMYDEINNLYYLKNTGYYVYGNIGFGILSVFDLHDYSTCGLKDNVKFPDGDILHQYFQDNQHINLALLHTTVKNSSIQTHEGYDKYLENYDNHIDVKDIKNYDYILLGDIHKQQFIKNAGYPSSLVQQNFGEDPINHGYIFWDLYNKKYEFIRVYSEYAMIKCKLKIETNKKNQKIVNIQLPMYEDYNEYPKKLDIKIIIEEYQLEEFIDNKNTKDDLIKLIKEWFNKNNFYITNLEIIFDNPKIKNIIDEKTIIDNSINWLDINTIEKYLKEFSNDLYLIEEYKKIHEIIIIKKIKNECKNWKLISLEWSNLFSYGEQNYIDFYKDKINIILGENFTGKSSILDVLIYTIYGSVYRCDKLLQIINVNQKSGYSSLVFKYGNITYKIERYLKKKITKKNENHSQKIYVKKIIGNDISDIIVNLNSWTGEKLIETPDKIDDFVLDIFGTKNNFLSTYILNQNNNNSFVHMKNTERKELLESWLQLDLLEDSRKQIKIYKKDKEDEYNKLKGALDQCFQNFENIKSTFDYEKYEEYTNNLKNDIENYENDLKCFENYKMLNEPSYPYILYNNKKYNTNFIELIMNNKNNLLKIKEKIKNIDYDENYHNKLIDEYSKLKILYNSSSIKLQNLENKLKTYDIIENSNKCLDDLENLVSILTNDIDSNADEYFKNEKNIIPFNRNKKSYMIFMDEYDKFKKNNIYDFNRLNDDLENLKLKRKNYLELNNKKNEIFTNIKLLEQKIKTLNHGYIFNIENLNSFINVTNIELENYWKLIEKNCKILNIKIDKSEKYIQNSFYDNLLNDIIEWEKDQNIIKEKYIQISSFNSCKHDKVNYENLMNELKNIDTNLKTLSKFKFSKTCECCNENINTLKVNKYMTSKNNINNKLKDLDKIYKNYENLLNISIEYENYLKWVNNYDSIQSKNQKLRYQYDIYIDLKRIHRIYLKIKDKLEYYMNEKENVNIYNQKLIISKNIDLLYDEYNKIDIIDISKLSNQILEIENILQKNRYYTIEYEEWKNYIDKFDIYEEMQNKQKNNITLRSKISDIQKEIRSIKIYEEYIDIKAQYEYHKNENETIYNDKIKLENNLNEYLIIKDKYIENRENEKNLLDLEKNIQIMDMMYSQYNIDIENYNIKYEEYKIIKNEYDQLKLKYNVSKEKLIKSKVELDIIKEKYKQYINIKNIIDLKTSELYEVNKLYSIYSKLNDLLSINGYNYWIYKNIIPILNSHTNKILNNIVDFTCDIELVSDNIKSTSIDIYIQNSNNNIKIPIKMSSGFQQQIVSIAIRIALINLSNNKGSCIFMDESFSSFDVNYQSKIPELLNYFSKNFDNIWIISHIENLQKDIEGKYIVKKSGLYSKVYKI